MSPLEAARRAMIAAGVDPDAVVAQAATVDLDEPEPAPPVEAAPTVEEAMDDELGLSSTPDYGEQGTLIDEVLVALTYENLLPPADVAAYKRVKSAEQRIAHETKQIAARLVGGTVGDGDRSDKHFIQTSRGLYRFANSLASDNSSETAMHEQMGVTRAIHLPNIDEVVEWFDEHGLDGRLAYQALTRDLRARFRT